MKEINELEAMDIVDILFSDLYLYSKPPTIPY